LVEKSACTVDDACACVGEDAFDKDGAALADGVAETVGSADAIGSPDAAATGAALIVEAGVRAGASVASAGGETLEAFEAELAAAAIAS